MHYQRQRHGKPLFAEPNSGNRAGPVEGRLTYEVSPSGCWLFTGGYLDEAGYGAMTHKGKWTRTHRIAYEVWVGPIPPEKYVLHGCDNPTCINPAHLRVGTHRDNLDDMVERGRANNGRAARTNCPKGHKYDYFYAGSRNGNIHRGCKKCHLASQRARKARLRAEEDSNA